MKNNSVSFSRYFLAVTTLFIAGLSAPLAIAQQIGFYPISTYVNDFGNAIGDINNDNRDDRVRISLSGPIIPINGSTVSRYLVINLCSDLNSADGSFLFKSCLATNLYSYQVGFDNAGALIKQLVDINGDGKLDVLVVGTVNDGQLGTGDPRSSGLAVFFGNGDGTFNPSYKLMTLPLTNPSVSGPSSFRFGDMNKDGKADLVTNNGATIEVYLGDGIGGFGSAPVSSTPITAPARTSLTGVNSIQLVDANNDGVLDITFLADNPTAGEFGQSPHVMFALPNGTYEDRIIGLISYPIGTPLPRFNNLIAQKTSVTGPVALIANVSSPIPDTMDSSYGARAWLGDAQGIFIPVTTLTDTPAVFADFDADGIVDVVTINFSYASTVRNYTFRFNKGISPGNFIEAGNFLQSDDTALLTITGPYRFGNASTPGVLLSKYAYLTLTASTLPVVTLPVVQPPALPKFTAVSDITVKEGQVATFAVRLSAATTQASTVKLTLVNGTATSGLDYSTALKYSDDNGVTYQSLASGGTATLKAGVSGFLVQVTTLTDALAEADETYNLYLDAVSGISTAVRGWGIGTIQNVAPIVITPPPKFTAVSDITVNEGQVATFTATLSGPTSVAAQVKLSLVNGTATGGPDYSTSLKYSDDNGVTYQTLASGGVASIRAGVSRILVQVTTLRDTRTEPIETYNLYLDPVAGIAAGRGWGIGKIVNLP